MADAAAKVLQRNSRQCNVIEWVEETKLVFKRYRLRACVPCFVAPHTQSGQWLASPFLCRVGGSEGGAALILFV